MWTSLWTGSNFLVYIKWKPFQFSILFSFKIFIYFQFLKWLASSQTQTYMDMLLKFGIGDYFSTFGLPCYAMPHYRMGFFQMGFADNHGHFSLDITFLLMEVSPLLCVFLKLNWFRFGILYEICTFWNDLLHFFFKQPRLY